MSLHIIILAAGKGKRMYSSIPKVLHQLAGKPLLAHVIDTAMSLGPKAIHVVYGHQGEIVRQHLRDYSVNWVKQNQQLGTAHAVMQVLPHLEATAKVLILYGDVPLIKLDTIKHLVAVTENKEIGLLLAKPEDPTGLGRVVRDAQKNIIKIVEHKDADPEQLSINEIFSGIAVASVAALNRWLPTIDNNNSQQEYYLPQIVQCAVNEKITIIATETSDQFEIQGVNDRCQLNCLERHYQSIQARQLMLSGVSIADAQRIDIRGKLICAADVSIDINTLFEGENTIGEHSYIGPNCTLKNCKLGKHVIIEANSVLDNCEIADYCHVGPFARLRPETVLKANAKIGNFVEVKKSVIGENSKVNHLSYIGDAILGTKVNIGAGTITCNYDGVNKYQTIIEDGVFVGSDTQLIAPVHVGSNATIGAGTTVRADVPAEQLTVNDTKQKTISNWKRPEKANKE